MPFDIEKIKRESKVNYEKAWLETVDLLKLKGTYFSLEKKGGSHFINDFIVDARKKMISLGFEELVLPMFVDEQDVYKQYGPEAVLILDRLFYLAGLPRPDIGVSNEKVERIREIVPDFKNIEVLKQIFRDYKRGDIEADDLIETFIKLLNLNESQASSIIDNIFPELKQLKPIPTRSTLRSHTTALWFKVLEFLVKKKKLPLQYFTIGQKFRREQKLDSTHLYVSNTLSIVIMAEEISLEDCQDISLLISKEIGFADSKIEIKKATSKYYAPQTEFEIYVNHPTTKNWIEIGDGGLYSPVSLANYNISYPVFNVGFGIERICMIKSQVEDIRRLVYPYYYEDVSFSDKEISNSIRYKYVPLTEKGLEIQKAILTAAIKNKDLDSPIEIKAWEGNLKGKKIEVLLWERDDNVKLLGPAALNEIWVNDGNVLGVPSDKVPDGAISANKSYLEGIASEMAYNIEIMLEQNIDKYEHRVKMCYRASEVNLELDDIVLEYIHSKQKKVDIRGPVFIGLSFNKID
ncbi:MAG: O-phosphoserine--tRNA ligase [Candidatus Hodarchaeota archaeon]